MDYFPTVHQGFGQPQAIIIGGLLVAKTGLKFIENRNLASFNFTTLLLPQHNQDMSHLALKVCKRKPSLKICNWKGWCCSTTWQPLLVLNVLLPWRETSWHKKIGPSTGIPTCVKSTFHVHKSHLMLYKCVLCTLVHIMYMVPSETHGAPQNHNKTCTLPTFSKSHNFQRYLC